VTLGAFPGDIRRFPTLAEVLELGQLRRLVMDEKLKVRRTASGLIAWRNELKWIDLLAKENKGILEIVIPEGWLVQHYFGGACCPFMVLELSKALLEWAVKENKPVRLSIDENDSWEFSPSLQYLLRRLVIWRQ
jgi:hypothetical protein